MQINNPGRSLRRQEFTASGVFTVPVGVDQIIVTLVSGGGGGGSGRAGAFADSGGGGGGASGDVVYRARIAVTQGENYGVTVGSGGGGGASVGPGNDGVAGVAGGGSFLINNQTLKEILTPRRGNYGFAGVNGVAAGGQNDVYGLIETGPASMVSNSGGDGQKQSDGVHGRGSAFCGLSHAGTGGSSGGGGGGGGRGFVAAQSDIDAGAGGDGGATPSAGASASNNTGGGGGGGGGSKDTASGGGGNGGSGYGLIEWWQ